MKRIFAPFGFSEELVKMNCSSSLDVPEALRKLDLNGYEYSCKEGIHISEDGCEVLKQNAQNYYISLSLYMGNLYSLSGEKGIEFLSDCIETAINIGAQRVVIPLENCAVTSRKTVLERTIYSISEARKNTNRDIIICPELMGKIHDFGTLEEIISMCADDETLVPALNLPNLFGRNLGENLNYDDWIEIFKNIENKIGCERTNMLHMYFSKAYFTNQGLKKYTDFSDMEAPDFHFKPIIRAIKDLKLNPFMVCISPKFEITDLFTIKKEFERN